MYFTFSDLVAGYVTQFHWDRDSFGLRTSDGREFEVAITPTTNAQMVRNLGEPYADATTQMRDMLVPNRYVYAYGVFYLEGGQPRFEAKQITFLGRRDEDYP